MLDLDTVDKSHVSSNKPYRTNIVIDVPADNLPTLQRKAVGTAVGARGSEMSISAESACHLVIALVHDEKDTHPEIVTSTPVRPVQASHSALLA